MWKIPFTDRDTDRYRLRVPTEFTDLPTLLWGPCVRPSHFDEGYPKSCFLHRGLHGGLFHVFIGQVVPFFLCTNCQHMHGLVSVHLIGARDPPVYAAMNDTTLPLTPLTFQLTPLTPLTLQLTPLTLQLTPRLH